MFARATMLGVATAGQTAGSLASTFMSRAAPLSFFRYTNLRPVREFRYTEPVQMGRRAAKIAGRKVRPMPWPTFPAVGLLAAHGAPLAGSAARKHGAR
jgi:hypothetical protein